MRATLVLPSPACAILKTICKSSCVLRLPIRVWTRAAAMPGGVTQHVQGRPEAELVDIAILGDLHLKENVMQPFLDARKHFQRVFRESSADTHAVIQLGDLGTGATSGSTEAFEYARGYLQSYDCPFNLVTGNHDLEGVQFDTDEANLAAWREVFQQHHFWARDVGPCVVFGLSTTKFRSNALSHHEVHIDEEQLAWFERALRQVAPGKPAVVCTHAPPMGCGLKVLHSLHIKNRCAWLNHSGNSRAFMDIVDRHPRVRAWFSGHFHLAQNYADSIVAAGGCAFAQVGVIGEHCHRDGFRQSRLLRASAERCQILTVDHEDGGRVRLDLDFAWRDPAAVPAPVTPDEEIICDVAAGYLCARDACSVLWRGGVVWWTVNAATLLAKQDDMLVEYDMATFAPTGVVTRDTRGRSVHLIDISGADVTANVPGDGATVLHIQLRDADGTVHEQFERNKWGSFFQVFQPNKWNAEFVAAQRQKLEAQQTAERETIMV